MDRGRLADAVKHRRLSLDMGHGELATATGLTRATISKIENGHPVSDRTLYKLDPGLGWIRGSSKRILNGADAHEQLTRADGLEMVRARIPRVRDVEDELERLAGLPDPWFWIEVGRVIGDDER